MEYTIILGVVSLALITMNIYIKRGLQGKVKDMTDYFIGREQIIEINPTAVTNSQTANNAFSQTESQMLAGGATTATTTERANISATSRVIDTGRNPINPDTGGYVGSEAGSVTPPARPDEKQVQAAESGRDIGTGGVVP